MPSFIPLLFVIGFALLDCQNVQAQASLKPVLRIDSEINQAAFEKVRRFLKRGGKEIVVNSVGGDVRYGHKIAAAFLGRDIGVSVEHYCLSSCANYLFLAASRMSLQPGAVLGFHGGAGYPEPIQKSGDTAAVLPSSIVNLQIEEKKLFEKIGVDYRLISHSLELVKSNENRIYVEFNGDVASRQIFELRQKAEAATLIAERIKLEPNTKWSIHMLNLGASSKMYFPSEQTLRNAGVKGIEQYPYPKNAQELAQLATEVGIELVGDFVDNND